MKEDRDLKKRIREGKVSRKDVTRMLAELACGKVNDCVRLALEREPCLDKLDLRLLAGVKRCENGTVEVRLIDRLQVMKQLAETAEEETDSMGAFLQELQGGDGV